MSKLFIQIKYDLQLNHYEIKTSIKKDKIEEIINTFLRSQIGKGEDTSKSNEQNIYTFNIDVDLTYDIIKVSSDTGNESLRDGIFMNLVNQLKHDPHCITWKDI